MSSGGWIKLYRKTRQSFVWADPNLLKLWLLILFKARHEPGKIVFNGHEQLLNSGQLVAGRAALAIEMNEGVRPAQKVNSSFISRALKKFEEAGMLNIKTTTKYSVITVTNWDTYQQSEQVTNINRTAVEQLPNTNKNDKNDKNISSSSTTLSDVFTFWESNGFGMTSPKTREDLAYWVDDFKKIGSTEQQANELLVKAMGVAIDANVRKYAYVNSVLRNWEQHHLKTVDEVNAHEQQRAAQRDQRNASASNNKRGGKSYGGIVF